MRTKHTSSGPGGALPMLEELQHPKSTETDRDKVLFQVEHHPGDGGRDHKQVQQTDRSEQGRDQRVWASVTGQTGRGPELEEKFDTEQSGDHQIEIKEEMICGRGGERG